MADVAERVTVGTTATAINRPSTDNIAGKSASIQPLNGTIYVGGPDVTTTDGYPVASGDTFSRDLMGTDAVFAVAAGDVEVAVYWGGI